MPECPTFSVVIPCYNYGHYLAETLESVFAQNRNDVEIVLVDDASTDDTPVVARRYGNRITYLRNERNLGAGGAWQFGLGRARGQYVMKLDADDALRPGCFDAVAKAFERDPATGVVISSVMVHFEQAGVTDLELVTQTDRELSPEKLRRKLLHGFFFRMPGCVLRRAILQGHEPPDAELYQIHDWEYFLRVMRGHKAQLLREPSAIYRVHEKSITSTAQFDDRLYKDIERWLEIAPKPGDRHIEINDLRELRGSFAVLMINLFNPQVDAKPYARFISTYFRAMKISVPGGLWQVARFHLPVVDQIRRKLARMIGA